MRPSLLSIFLASLLPASFGFAQSDPASEPAVLAVAKALPAVVNINTERVVRRQVRDPFEDFAAQFFGNYRGSRPREIRQTVQSLGSGFLVDPTGFIVTNEHVVERAADLKIQVTMNDGKTYSARYITGDPKKDLAFIKIDGKNLPFIDLANTSPNLLGQTVLVVGNALGYGSSISRGILSGVKRDITIEQLEYKDLLQTDAAINPGNSGGPLVDLSARLVGVSSAKMAFTPQGVPTQGLGFAIPAETVRASVAQFRKVAANQPASRPTTAETDLEASSADRLFGLQLQDLTAELTDALGLAAGKGVLISAVEPDSPAQQAGIERGLVIYKVGRYEVNSVKQVETLLARAGTGTTVDFAVGGPRRRGVRGQTQIESVSLVAR